MTSSTEIIKDETRIPKENKKRRDKDIIPISQWIRRENKAVYLRAKAWAYGNGYTIGDGVVELWRRALKAEGIEVAEDPSET